MTVRDSQVRNRLQRLWKGTLIVGVAGIYAALLATVLILFGWRAALLAVFLVVLAQCFRYIANDIDRLGWAMANAASAGGDGFEAATQRNQARLRWLLGPLALLPGVGLVGQVFALAGWQAALVVAAAVAFIELLFGAIRRVNRRTAFGEASYGFRDKSLFAHGPESIRELADARAAHVERQLEELKAMVDDGKVSQRAYEKACDKYRVDLVMKQAAT